jgi:hypothetical protein
MIEYILNNMVIILFINKIYFILLISVLFIKKIEFFNKKKYK